MRRKEKSKNFRKSKLIGIFKKNKSEEIRISEMKIKGNEVIDIRVFSNYRNQDYQPTKNGFTFLKEKWNQFVESVINVT